MALLDNAAFQGSANLSLWFKLTAGDPLNLADIPSIISLRWPYFRDNWNFLRLRLIKNAAKNPDPSFLLSTIDKFTSFIDREKTGNPDVNPFASTQILHTFYPIFDSILIKDIKLSNEEQTIIADQKRVVQAYSKSDFLKIKSSITSYRDSLADLDGLSDPTYNSIFNRGAVTAQVSSSLSDLNLMLTLQKQLDAVNFILANLFAIDTALDPFALARQNAKNSGLNIGQYSSGFLVKLNYGEDLQGLATRYFKDPNKWIDIAIANGLKEPYIDEVGEQLFLAANGSGNQVNLLALDSNGNPNIDKFYINQSITVQSTAIPFPDQRVILDIREIPISGEIVLTLDGDATLGQYLLAGSASIRVFAVNTINSSQFILIPSSQPLPNNRQEEIPWFLVGKAADEKLTKVDIAIGNNGQLLLASNGDIALSFGLANAIQALRMKLLTELGTNRYHPTYGIVNVVGSRNLDIVSLKSALISSITSQIQVDGRFDRVESLDIQQDGTALTINLSVRLAGGSTVVPISFTVTR